MTPESEKIRQDIRKGYIAQDVDRKEWERSVGMVYALERSAETLEAFYILQKGMKGLCPPQLDDFGWTPPAPRRTQEECVAYAEHIKVCPSQLEIDGLTSCGCGAYGAAL